MMPCGFEAAQGERLKYKPTVGLQVFLAARFKVWWGACLGRRLQCVSGGYDIMTNLSQHGFETAFDV